MTAPTLTDVARARRGATVQLLSRDALDHVDELLEAVVALLVEAEPAGFYDEEGLADLRAAARDGVVSVLNVMGGVLSVEDGPMEVPREGGRRQVPQSL